MSDLIRRSELRATFERECIGECGCCVHVKHDPEGCALIDNASPVDAVEVVRCKDCACSAVDAFVKCRFCVRLGEVRPNGAVWGGVGVRDDHFCSYGRRREGDA